MEDFCLWVQYLGIYVVSLLSNLTRVKLHYFDKRRNFFSSEDKKFTKFKSLIRGIQQFQKTRFWKPIYLVKSDKLLCLRLRQAMHNKPIL